MLLACLAFSFNFMACTDDDGDGDGPEVDDSIRTRTFESADYNSGWKYFSYPYRIYSGGDCRCICNQLPVLSLYACHGNQAADEKV